MTGRLDKHGQLHLTIEKDDALTTLNPPTVLLTVEQTDQLRDILNVPKPVAVPEKKSHWWGCFTAPKN